MTLKHRKIDIVIDGKALQNRIIEPSSLIMEDPHMKMALSEEVFDHLLNRVRQDKEVVFSFKAKAPGFMLESEAKIDMLGYDFEKKTYFAVLLLL